MSSNRGNLTEGSIFRVLTKLSMPIVIAAFFSTAYSITDMVWIGKLGGEVVAGVGTGGMYVWLSSGHIALSRMGGQILAAQELGKGNRTMAVKYAAETIRLTILSGILFGAICLLFTDALVGYYGLDSVVANEAGKIYLRIVCGLIIFSYMGQVLTGLFTAQGDSRTPMIANFIGLSANMILDPLLIFGVGPLKGMGVVGASIATVTAQIMVVAVMLLHVVRDKKNYNILKEVKIIERTDRKIRNRIIKMGFPSAVQSMVYCIISMILSRMVSGFGDAVIAVFRVGGQFESISWNVANGFSSAMNAFSAQNFGAGRMDRVRKGYRISFITVVIWGGFITFLMVVFPAQISGVFFHTAEEIILCSNYFIIVGLSQIFMCVELMSVGAISGLGNTKICSIISVTLTVIRIPIAFVLCATPLAENGLWWALTISSVLKGIIFWGAFHRESKKNERGRNYEIV